MKITQVELYEVEIPPIPAIARYYPKIYDITLCRVQTDEGLEGWGEFLSKKSAGQEQADALVGQDPLALDPYDRPDAFTCACSTLRAKPTASRCTASLGRRCATRCRCRTGRVP